jgi:hypothetical protein
MSPEFRYDVFLSHSGKDKPVVRPVVQLLWRRKSAPVMARFQARTVQP